MILLTEIYENVCFPESAGRAPNSQTCFPLAIANNPYESFEVYVIEHK